MIPFKVGIFVTGKDFCDREAEIRKLIEYIESSKGLEKKRILLRRGHNWHISTPFFIHWFKISGLV